MKLKYFKVRYDGRATSRKEIREVIDEAEQQGCRVKVAKGYAHMRPRGFMVAEGLAKGVTGMYHTVYLRARANGLTADPDLSDRFLTELEHQAAGGRLAGPVTGQNGAEGTVDATFSIDNAPSPNMALSLGQAAFAEALAAATSKTVTNPDYVEIQVVEVHEEAASLA